MNTIAFSTRNEIVETKKRPHVEGIHIIGLDMGYSGPKCYHENGHFVFPNFCKKLSGELFNEPRKTDIIYENTETGEKYSVGLMALGSISDGVAFSDQNLFGRNHYLHPEFRIKLETSLGIALWNIDTDGSDVFLQTGLPPAYMVEDRPYLIDAASGNHNFKLTIGSKTKEFDFVLPKENVGVMMQPMGTFNSLMFDEEGKLQSIAKSITKSNLLIFDGGFGTLDTFFIRANQLQNKTTDASLGMRRVLEETKALIEKDLGVSPSIIAMQRILKEGVIKVSDKRTFTQKEYPVDEYLQKANDKVCAEALDSISDYIFDIRYLIMTGGTSDAWFDIFKKRLSGSGIEILKGSTGTNLPNIYANARGYYFSKYRKEVFK